MNIQDETRLYKLSRHPVSIYEYYKQLVELVNHEESNMYNFLLMLFVASIAVVPNCVIADEFNIERVIRESRESERKFSSFYCQGEFERESLDESIGKRLLVAGSFNWHQRGQRFRCSVAIDRSIGLSPSQSVMAQGTFELTSDGESIVVVHFSDAYSNGCDANLYPAGSAAYKAAIPFFPIDLHKGSSLFRIPDACRDNFGSLQRRKSKLIGTYRIGNQSRITFRLSEPIGFLFDGMEAEHDGVTVTMDHREYVSRTQETTPGTIQRTHYFRETGEKKREVILRFHKFDFNMDVEDRIFTLAGVDFCKGGRIVDRMASKREDIVVRMEGNEEFRSDNPSIRSAVDNYRANNNQGGLGIHFHTVPWGMISLSAGALLFALATWYVGRKRFNRA